MANKKTVRRCLVVILAAIAICGVVFIVLPVARVIYFFAASPHMSVREYVTVSLPDGIHEIKHSRIGVNPIVAEYSRDVAFIADGTQGRTTPLSMDTCGGYPINCYVVETANGALLRLNDAVSEHLLDPRKQIAYLIVRVGDVPYVGELTDEKTDWGICTSNNDPSTLSVTVGNKAATPLAQLVGDAKEHYIGAITGNSGNLRFVPVAEQPESPIRKLRDR
jgi:hypothetical protein